MKNMQKEISIVGFMMENKAIIGTDNGLSPECHEAIIWNNAGILLIRPLGTNFSDHGDILIEIHTFSFKKMHLEMLSEKRLPSCLGFNVLNKPLNTGLSPMTTSDGNIYSDVQGSFCVRAHPNERRYNVASFLIGWALIQNDPWILSEILYIVVSMEDWANTSAKEIPKSCSKPTMWN